LARFQIAGSEIQSSESAVQVSVSDAPEARKVGAQVELFDSAPDLL
jgi:hypothetical protein